MVGTKWELNWYNDICGNVGGVQEVVVGCEEALN